MARLISLLKPACAAIVLLCIFAAAPLHAQTPPAFRPDRILVKPNAGADLAPLHAALHTRVLRTFPAIGGLQVLQLPGDLPVDDAIAAYQASGFVRYAERDFILHLLAEPNDFRYLNGDLWNLHNTGIYGGKPGADIKATEAWDIQRTAPNVIVAVIDTGIRLTHEDLAPNLWVNPGESGAGLLGLDKRQNLLDDDGNGFIDDVHGINAILGIGLPLDDYGHGTHVSGIIGAAGNNTAGPTSARGSRTTAPTRFISVHRARRSFPAGTARTPIIAITTAPRWPRRRWWERAPWYGRASRRSPTSRCARACSPRWILCPAFPERRSRAGD